MLDLVPSAEFEKAELKLEINAFDNPTRLNDLKAWSQLLLNLLFLRPGTYPSQPEMGIDIKNYQYDFIDEAINEISGKIITQQQLYLPDVPLVSVDVFQKPYKTEQLLIIRFVFNKDMQTMSSAVAINMDSKRRKFLDFAISWE